MLLARIVRTGRLAGAAVVMVGLIVGCGSPTPAPVVNKSAPLQGQPTKSEPGKGGDPGAATKAATDLLTAVKDGKATPTLLTVEFKKLIAAPTSEADKAVGYSDWETGHWLKDQATKVGTTNVTVSEINADTVIVTASPPTVTPPVGRTVARMVKVGANLQLDWLHVAPAGSTDLPLTGSSAGVAGNLIATAFLDNNIQKQSGVLAKLLTPALKKRLAPPLDSIDESLGYNRGILSIKFTNFRDTATSYTVVSNANHTNANDMTFTYTGELIAPGGNRKFTLKLTRGSPPDSWLVDDFQPN